MCLCTVQIAMQVKSWRKASGSAAYDWVKFEKCNEGYRLVHVRNRCRIIWVVSRYTCHFKRILSGFQASTALCIYVIYANSWINTARPNIVWIQSGNPWAVRRWQTERGMALSAIEGVSQWGVVGCSGSRTLPLPILVLMCVRFCLLLLWGGVYLFHCWTFSTVTISD